MLNIIFSLDYEIHGNGQGSPFSLMIEPTQRLLRQFNRYGAKLTIMAEVCQILRFKNYLTATQRDDFYYRGIVSQLQEALSTGHDVQLHLHSSYANAEYDQGSWRQDYSDYNLASLGYQRINHLILKGKEFLNEILTPVKPDYQCFVFRAANWCMVPSNDIISALIANGFKIDTSVFKYGKRERLVNFDYSDAYSNLIPWPVDKKNICHRDEAGELYEFPIYCEQKDIFAFLTLNRIVRALQAFFHPHKNNGFSNLSTCSFKRLQAKILPVLTSRYPWKFDFNQCTGRQLINALRRIEQKYSHITCDLPVVLIGHSKTFNSINQNSLEIFLQYILKNNDRYSFARFGDIDLTQFMGGESQLVKAA